MAIGNIPGTFMGLAIPKGWAVWMCGTVIEHEHGYRAQYASVRSLDFIANGDEKLLAILRQKYLPEKK